jgi:hypothetical protein
MDLGPPTFARPATAPCQGSVLLPVRNAAATVGEALASVLTARDVVLDVLILDDASTDDTAARIRAALAAAVPHPHGIRFWTGQPHRGLDANAALTAAAATEFCIAQHGDDLSESARFRRILDLFATTGADVVSTDLLLLEDGRLSPRDYEAADGFIPAGEIVARGWLPPMLGATLAWRRRVHADFPRLDTQYLFFGHDWIVPFRGALRGGFHHTRERLLRYRVHAGQWVHRLADGRSPGAATENKLFRHLAVLRAMAADCRHLLAGPAAGRGQAEELLPRISAQQAALLEFFIVHRESLLRDGRRPLWIDAGLFDQIQAEGYRDRFWDRGRWRRLSAWWRARRKR